MSETIEVAYLPVWRRYRTMFQEAALTDAQKGKLLGYMMDYQFDGQEPQGVPRSLVMAWAFIKKDMDDARVKYEVAVRNGRKGGRPKKSNQKAK